MMEIWILVKMSWEEEDSEEDDMVEETDAVSDGILAPNDDGQLFYDNPNFLSVLHFTSMDGTLC